jgi:hypothetical protein
MNAEGGENMADSNSNDALAIDQAKTYRPETIAAKLGVSGKLVRSFLRATYTRPIEAKGTTWVLTGEQAQATIDHFVARRAKNDAE